MTINEFLDIAVAEEDVAPLLDPFLQILLPILKSSARLCVSENIQFEDLVLLLVLRSNEQEDSNDERSQVNGGCVVVEPMGRRLNFEFAEAPRRFESLGRVTFPYVQVLPAEAGGGRLDVRLTERGRAVAIQFWDYLNQNHEY